MKSTEFVPRIFLPSTSVIAPASSDVGFAAHGALRLVSLRCFGSTGTLLGRNRLDDGRKRRCFAEVGLVGSDCLRDQRLDCGLVKLRRIRESNAAHLVAFAL